LQYIIRAVVQVIDELIRLRYTMQQLSGLGKMNREGLSAVAVLAGFTKSTVEMLQQVYICGQEEAD
jgi:hypothetical protein